MTEPTHLVICIGNEGAEDLQVLRVYRRLSDEAAEARGFLRVIDDSGEDYLYPEGSFLALPYLPRWSNGSRRWPKSGRLPESPEAWEATGRRAVTSAAGATPAEPGPQQRRHHRRCRS